MQPRFDSLDDEPGLEIVDPIEGNRFVLYTPAELSPTYASTDGFAFPVTAACEVVTESFSLPYAVVFAVRDAADASQIAEIREGTYEFEADEYLLELNAPVKLYVRVERAFEVEATDREMRVSFDGAARVQVGARSYHSSPAATVTVPDDPEAMMDAVSTFGSALKTTSCERSWPTLRGHPPRVERGAELSIPADLDPPDTGVTLRVPADYEHVFAVAPLAYYLGASVVADDEPRLTTDAGFEHSFDTARGFEDEVVRTLRRAFFLDCVTRTEGYYRIPLHERRRLERRSAVDLDFAALYDRPLAEQLEAYLSVPYSALDEMQTWNRVTYVRPDPETVEFLPFVVDDLSLVRVRTPTRRPPPSGSRPERDTLASFKRRPGPGSAEGADEASESDDRGARPYGVPRAGGYVPLPETSAIERAWVGDETPVHGAKLLGAAFDHDRTRSSDGVTNVTVVCNDDRMRDEWDAVSDVYGSRDVVAFDVDCRFDATTDELRDLLERDTDLFHYIGHIDGRGFECPDGVFDAATLEATGATTVLLNACRSYDQGRTLVDAGARAAVVSTADVDNLAAIEIGETVARLLNYGFGVASALEVAEEYTAIGRHYVALGDPSVTVAQCEDGTPVVLELSRDRTGDVSPADELSVTIRSYEYDGMTMGSIVCPLGQDDADETYYLAPGVVDTLEIDFPRFERVVADQSLPVVVDGELAWSDEWLSTVRNRE